MPDLDSKQTPVKASPQLSGLSGSQKRGDSLKTPLTGGSGGGSTLAPGTSVFDSKDYVAGKDNVWQLMLQKASRKTTLPNATMIVLGDKKNGKTAVLNRFGERVASGLSAEYVLDYSYLPVRNRYNADKDEVLGSLNVYQWDDPAHADVLQHFAAAHGLEHTVYVLTVSLAEPWNVLRSVQNWLAVLTAQHTKIFDKLPADDVKKLKDKICAYTQLYVDPSVKKKQAAGDLKGSAATAGELEMAKAAVNPAIPKYNLGVPLVIVGTKAELLNKKGSGAKAGSGGAGTGDDRFEFLLRRLRKVAIDYGAALLFTSAAGGGQHIELLQDYVYHRLYGFQLDAPAKAVCSVANDDTALYVPAGYDSMELIDPVAAAAAGKAAKDVPIVVGHWNESTPMETVFDSAESKAKSGKQTEEVTALENVAFYRMLQAAMEKDNVRLASASVGGGVGGGGIGGNTLSVNTGGSHHAVAAHQAGVAGRQSLQIPVSPSASASQQNKATLEKLDALRRTAGAAKTPTHSQSTRDLHAVSGATPNGKPDAASSGGSGTTTPSSAAAAIIEKKVAAPAGAGGGDMKKTAVKAFFKSLLNSSGAAAAAGASGSGNAPPPAVTGAAGGNAALRTAARSTLDGQQ